MTTITWDLRTLSADTLVSDSAAMVMAGFINQRNWTLRTKLWVPDKHLTFEHSPIVAVGASGNVLVGNLIVDYLFDRNLPAGTTRPSTPLESNLAAYATAVLGIHNQDASLLILTESHCWRLKVLPGKPVNICDVTAHPTAIGAGAQVAQQCLDAGMDGVKSIIEAARHTDSETNFSIDYVDRTSSPIIERARQSHTTLRDPQRLNRVITRSIALIGGGLTAVGGIAIQACGFAGAAQILLVALTMAGIVATVSSILTSLWDTKGAKYHLVPIATMALLLVRKESESFLEAHQLTPLILLYFGTVFALIMLRIQWPWVSRPRNAVHLGACLTLGSLLAALTLFSQVPYDWPLLFAGTIGVGLGYTATLLAVNFMIRNHYRHHVIIERIQESESIVRN
ncbi:MAG: hypothetical protein ACNJA3_28165 (plasmid) [Pseudomonas rhizophila]|uniref:hypothetical protein n=1 Tax=Pseudomonas rhizophila TaxID=2045200 RepID=UPI003F6B9460